MADHDKKSEKVESGEKKPVDESKPDRGMEKSYSFKVNGVEIQSPHQKLVALDVLKLAKDKEAIPGKPEEYILQGDKGKYKLDDWVDLDEDNVFITIPNTATPVA